MNEPSDVPDAYVGAFVREFAKHIGDLSVQTAVDCAEGYFDMTCGDPAEDARSEADEWRRAS